MGTRVYKSLDTPPLFSFVMEFRELSDGEWEVIRPLLPPRATVGRPRIDDRLVINGILYVLVTGCRWMDLPAKYGSYKTCWDRFRRWSVIRNGQAFHLPSSKPLTPFLKYQASPHET
jgi:hypothetical protein